MSRMSPSIKIALKNQIRRLLFSHFTLIFFCSLISPSFIHSFAYTLSASSREAWIAVLYYPTNYWGVFMYWRWTRIILIHDLLPRFLVRSTSDLQVPFLNFIIMTSTFVLCSMLYERDRLTNRTTWQVQKVRMLASTLSRIKRRFLW